MAFFTKSSDGILTSTTAHSSSDDTAAESASNIYKHQQMNSLPALAMLQAGIVSGGICL